ncbi:hypothetical protein [Kitasatospora sp. A2-31]|uniref:hypothetical protein n=1 Tax=Kitasatospora sp. A2-31 TaxID=2916414 RepID=UPI001EEBA7A2|nr:hypothetical protein [Kitasatospora sp. A2-31]MCG6495460.1 hypothetical protein [Kitasatospora sp. A2-31]
MLPLSAGLPAAVPSPADPTTHPAHHSHRPVALPAGLALAGGELVATAWVRPLNGDDEEWLAAQPPTRAGAAVVSELLARTVVRLGPWAPPPPERLLDLPIADRDLLLLAVRTSTYGHRFDVVLSCAACERPMDVSFAAGDIPVQSCRTPDAPLPTALPDGRGGVLEVALRPPNGRDQEAVAAAAAAGDPTPPVELLLQRCLVGVGGGPGGADGWERLPVPARGALAAAVDDASAKVELAMDLSCPECGVDFEADLDLAGYVLDEFLAPAGTVLYELHLLATAYHWSEHTIMSMPSPRRRALAGLVAQDLRAKGHG